MRFIADGPVLSDELLVSRDEGRVLFFCGAGVSRANAHLPGFLGLAEQVLDKLRALPDSAPRELISIANTLKDRTVSGVGSILAADRLFGLLERDFAQEDIDRAVGDILRPNANVDLTAHRIMLDLSRTPNGRVQLVTTNFDLLFEMVAPGAPKWTPDKLPDLQRGEGFAGIVHLHGVFDRNYTKPIGGNFVLSSGEFGRAYLAERWATDFIRDAVERYSVVFVGYTADDPPVQYLLEALNRISDRPHQQLYAFQAGHESEAAALWSHKGVAAIPYSTPNADHSALWTTLQAWSERARDPGKWRARLSRRAMKGPEKMAPHERGQVMHLAMTEEGVKSIVTAKRALPATWLRVFDPAERYETPGLRGFLRQEPETDSFLLYGLDSDPPPIPPPEHAAYPRREVPKGVLDALSSNVLDTTQPVATALRGEHADYLAPLPPRLLALIAWFAQVSTQPTAIWWALAQTPLHLVLLRQIAYRLDRHREEMPPMAQLAWRYIVDASAPRPTSAFQDIYAFQRGIARSGWTAPIRRALLALLTPRIKVSRPLAKGPAGDIRRARQGDLISIEIEYNDTVLTVAVPDDQLEQLVPGVRRHIENACALEIENNPYHLTHIPPIEPDTNLFGATYEREEGFSAQLFWYIGLYRRLILHNHEQAVAEFDAWGAQQNVAFDRLRIWAAGVAGLLDDRRAANVLVNLSDDAFWSERGQRDLLLALANRWNTLDEATRKSIGKRLRVGLPRLSWYKPEQYRRWRANLILDRLNWLRDHGCTFDFDLNTVLERAKADAPGWKAEYAAHAADSMEGHGGPVRSNTAFDSLANVPIDELLPRAFAASGRDHSTMTEIDPFAGLSQERPVRVLRALMRVASPNEETQLAWAQFLQSAARRADKARLVRLIARRLCEVDASAFAGVIRAATYWLQSISDVLYGTDPDATRAVFDRITAVVAIDPDKAVIHRRQTNTTTERDWLTSAIQSIAGELTGVLLHDPSIKGLQLDSGFPAPWQRRVETLLALPEDHGLFCLAMLGRHLTWLYAHDRQWTERHLLSTLITADSRREIFLTSFLSQPTIRDHSLYTALKPVMMDLVSGKLDRPVADVRALAQFLLGGWLADESGERWLSDVDLRTALVRGKQALRTTTLWQAGHWQIDKKLYLLREVWPLQLAARSPTVTDALCTLAFADEMHFPELAPAVLPFLTTLKGGGYIFLSGAAEITAILKAHPEPALQILWKVLPTNGVDWPHGASQAVDTLRKTSQKIQSYARMIELTRRHRKGHY